MSVLWFENMFHCILLVFPRQRANAQSPVCRQGGRVNDETQRNISNLGKLLSLLHPLSFLLISLLFLPPLCAFQCSQSPLSPPIISPISYAQFHPLVPKYTNTLSPVIFKPLSHPNSFLSSRSFASFHPFRFPLCLLLTSWSFSISPSISLPSPLAHPSPPPLSWKWARDWDWDWEEDEIQKRWKPEKGGLKGGGGQWRREGGEARRWSKKRRLQREFLN